MEFLAQRDVMMIQGGSRQSLRAHLQGTKARLGDQPAGQLIAEETEKWAKVVKFAGIKVE
jgi:hypothetical protein